ncbi:MAG: hypothetical protein KDN20_16525 [Verrucomicrobiae bacterium]|nr:hypothetical protein [Verrucomicrobiae bacterium]
MFRTAFISTVSAFLCSLALIAASPETLITFGVMGDVPYEAYEDELLPLQIAGLPDDLPFVVHVGDIKRGNVPCDLAVYQKVAGMLAKSKPPVFIIPGDNEYNDCTDPTTAWEHWEATFSRFDERWSHSLSVSRQSERSENFAFIKDRVLFVGIHLLGGRVQDPAEWKARHADDLRWVNEQFSRVAGTVEAAVIFGHGTPTPKHDDFFSQMAITAAAFQKPIAYIHGDSHKFVRDRPFKEVPNFYRIQIDRGGIAPPLRVSVILGSEEPFVTDRRMDAQTAGFPRSEIEAKLRGKK